MMNELQQRIFAEESLETAVCETDRRRERRLQMGRPVYLQPADPADAHFEEVRTMVNFSRTGFYFLTHRASYREGMQLHAIPAFGCFNFEYVAEVVRIEKLPFGEYGIAVRLLRLGNSLVNSSTITKSAFQSFALVEHIPPASSQQDSNS
jgi:hypothetical protein